MLTAHSKTFMNNNWDYQNWSVVWCNLGIPALNIGVTQDFFQSRGTLPHLRDEFIIYVSSAPTCETSFNILAFILAKPVAFLLSTWFSFVTTKSTDMSVNLKGVMGWDLSVVSRIYSNLVTFWNCSASLAPTVEKKLLKQLAIFLLVSCATSYSTRQKVSTAVEVWGKTLFRALQSLSWFSKFSKTKVL